MSELIQSIKNILQRDLVPVEPRNGDPLANLMPVTNNTLKYALHDGQVVGLNLAQAGLTDVQWGEILGLPGLAEHLQGLNLCENNLTTISFPPSIKSLKFLNLSENKSLTNVNLFGLTHILPLEELDLSECALKTFALPSFLLLQKFNISRNELTELSITGDCWKLKWFDASRNQLKSIVFNGLFAELKYLYLNDNQLEHIRFEGALEALELLHLRNNKLEHLPDLLPFTKLNALFLFGNPLRAMHDVISGDEDANAWEAVRSYMSSLEKSNLLYLHQAKMVLVGNGEVGKSSIRIKLLDKTQPLPQKHERTPGLEIKPYKIRALGKEITKLEDSIDFQLNIWDFGGQGKYREVQQLFCSRKTLYVFVTAHDDLPQKEDYVGFEYWLSMVDAYSFDDKEMQYSPVIHVVNKIDELEQPVNEKDRKESFPNLARFIKISCETLKNFDQLETAIREVLPEVSPDVFTAQFSEYWLAVKTELERRQSQNHISMTDYLQICKANQLDETEAQNWLRILDRIGTVIYFGENQDLKNWIILNPIWAKDALYKVLDNPLIEGGMLKPKFFSLIWQNYTSEEHKHLIQLMLAYKLCYEQKNARGEQEFVVPAMLHETAPDFPEYLKTPDYRLKFQFTPFIPAGTVNKLMVMLHDGSIPNSHSKLKDRASEKMERLPLVEAHNDFMWRNNVIARDVENNTYAHIREAWDEKMVYLDLYGENTRPIFEYIYAALDSINQTLKSTKYMTQLQLEALAWHDNEWEKLEKLKKYGIDFFPNNTTDFDIITTAKPQIMAPNIFVSYAWGGESEIIVDKIEKELLDRGITIVRDKKALGYLGSIKAFMEDIGRGNKVIVVLSKKYLESENCMFELTQIYQNKDFAARVFPIVLADSNIYKAVSRVGYIKYWDEKIAELDEALKSVERGTNLSELQQELNSFNAIRASFDKMAFVLKDMNALDPETHQNENFETLYTALSKQP